MAQLIVEIHIPLVSTGLPPGTTWPRKVSYVMQTTLAVDEAQTRLAKQRCPAARLRRPNMPGWDRHYYTKTAPGSKVNEDKYDDAGE